MTGPCAERATPTQFSYGGCLPCPRYELKVNETELMKDLQVAAYSGECVECLLRSGQPFFVGRPGMGAPEEVACAMITAKGSPAGFGRTDTERSRFWTEQRKTLKVLNGIQTKTTEDAMVYARCYAASVNLSDVVVRIGGGPYMPLRRPTNICAGPGRHHHQKTDVMLNQSGHFPERVLGDRGLNPWMLVAQQGLKMNESHDEFLPRAFAWTRALQGRWGPRSACRVPPHEADSHCAYPSSHAGRTVLVVHPFNNSIVSQLRRGSRALWGRWAEMVMPPGIHFKVVQVGFTKIARMPSGAALLNDV